MIAAIKPRAKRHDRRRFLGASEIAAVLGISPWMSPVELWQAKTGRTKPRKADPIREGILRRLQLANLERDLAQMEMARVQEQRYRELLAKEFIAREQYDQVRTNYAALGATVQADRASVENARASARAAEAMVDNARAAIRASQPSSVVTAPTPPFLGARSSPTPRGLDDPTNGGRSGGRP